MKNDKESQLKVIAALRRYQPDIVIANAIEDRHPNHGEGAKLAVDSCFFSGLRMIKTYDETGNEQKQWRPKQLFHYIQDRYIKPDFVINISESWHLKEAAIRAYKSQFYNPESNEPESYLSSPEFWKFMEARAREFGHMIGAEFGEGFTKTKMLDVKDIFDLL